MLISEPYRELNARQHHERPEWGRQSIKWWEAIRGLCNQLGVKTLLDYGCGKGMLRDALEPFGIEVTNYDPAIEKWSKTPEPHDFVVCTDVLEHVEPELLDNVLADLARVTKLAAFLVIATRASHKNLPDGTNPHRIIQPMEWWLGKLGQRFRLGTTDEKNGKVFAVMAVPK